MADTDNLLQLAFLLGDADNAQRVKLPFGVEAQRLDGQHTIVGLDLLPRDLRPTATQFTEVGFVLGRIRDGIFIEAKLPEGWSKRASDEACHSDIVDERLRVRGTIYFNAAFYERSAFAALFCRYRIRTWADEMDLKSCKVGIWDFGADMSLAEFGTVQTDNRGEYDEAVHTAQVWLDKSFPDHRSTNAYW